MLKRDLRACRLALFSISATLASCGAGTAVAVSGGGGGGGGGNAPPSLSGLTVLDPKRPDQARVRFVLADLEGDPADVQLFFQLPRGDRQPITQIAANPATLTASSDGIEHELPWNFAAEPSLPHNGSFVDGVRVIASLDNGQQEIVLGANDDFGLGNDPPEVHDPQPFAAEVAGVVPLEFSVSDSSSDTVSIKVEFDIVGDEPDLGWRVARPGGLHSSDPTPELAFPGVETTTTGADFVFFWDTDTDLAELERDVRVRFTARDDVVPGAAIETPVFRVDNNAEPSVSVEGELFLTSTDLHRGIPIPLNVIDEEEDPIDLAIQWRRPEESFPELPRDPASLRALLADPQSYADYHICTPASRPIRGRIVPIDEGVVELPELAADASHLLFAGLAGREIEILRGSTAPESATARWKSNPLTAPIAATPLGRGLTALVLDRVASGNWSLLEIELANGSVRRGVAVGFGTPTAMALERGEKRVLIGSESAGFWKLERIDLDSAERRVLATDDDPLGAGAIRGIASLGASSTLITVASSLLRVAHSSDELGLATPILSGLAGPWGIVLDPEREGFVYLAEHDALAGTTTGRIVSIDLDTHSLHEVSLVASGLVPSGLPRPRDLALTRSGRRLIALCDVDPSNGASEPRGVDVSGDIAGQPFSVGGPSSGVGSLAAGSDDLLLMTREAGRELLAGGGVEQVRRIDSYDPATRRATVHTRFDPSLRSNRSWRILDPTPPTQVRSDSEGHPFVFLWDSADLSSSAGGSVLVRATPLDTELGQTDATVAERKVAGVGFRFERSFTLGTLPARVKAADLDADGDLDLVVADYFDQTLHILERTRAGDYQISVLNDGPAIGELASPFDLSDLDGDGDLDLVCVEVSALRVHWQAQDGSFQEPLTLEAPGRPFSVRFSDVDSDGDPDLVSANSTTLTVFWQTAPGSFSIRPNVIVDPTATLGGLVHVTTADLDSDGDQDLIAADDRTHSVKIFWQLAPGTFALPPIQLIVSSPAPSIYGPAQAEAADMDGDGDLDLVTANGNSGTISIFRQSGPGSFEAIPETIGDPIVIGSASTVEIGDVNADGRLDLVSSGVVLWQNATGGFDPAPTKIVASAFSTTLADVNGDGRLDCLAVGSTSARTGELQLHTQLTASTLPEAVRLFNRGDSLSSASAAADLDGDGDLDLVAFDTSVRRLAVFWQVSPRVVDPTPTLVGPTVSANFIRDVAAADVDGDAVLDLVTASDDQISILWGTGSGSFSDRPTPLGNSTLRAEDVEIVDIDADGDLDIASANFGASALTVYRQTARGVFESTPLVLGSGPFSLPVSWALDAADVDGNGLLDLVVSSPAFAFVVLQSTNGVFNDAPIVLPGSVTNSRHLLEATDIDHDGDVDVATVDGLYGNIVVFWQTSPLRFERDEHHANGASSNSLVFFDVDRDNDLDLVSTGENSVVAFMQRRPGTFDPNETVLCSLSALPLVLSGLRAVDFDLDGDVDLIGVGAGAPYYVLWGGR